jgi:hypothetical protein
MMFQSCLNKGTRLTHPLNDLGINYNKDEFICVYEIGEDGEYKLTVTATDIKGNEINTEGNPLEFSISGGRLQ